MGVMRIGPNGECWIHIPDCKEQAKWIVTLVKNIDVAYCDKHTNQFRNGSGIVIRPLASAIEDTEASLWE